MITLITEVPIFKTCVYFNGNCDSHDAVKEIYNLKGSQINAPFTQSADGGVRDDGRDIFVWVKNLRNTDVIAHELAHVACVIMDIRGIPLCRETEEVMCYLIEWLTLNIQDKVVEQLQKLTKSN